MRHVTISLLWVIKKKKILEHNNCCLTVPDLAHSLFRLAIRSNVNKNNENHS